MPESKAKKAEISKEYASRTGSTVCRVYSESSC